MSKIETSEIDTVVKILKKLEPGLLPFELFHQIARLYVTPIIEIVPLKKTKSGEVTTILLQREKDDPVWPGMMHTPGTVVRASDTEGTFADAFNRILVNELCDLKIIHKPKLVGYEFHQVGRGRELALIFFVEYLKLSKCGKEFPIDALPDNIIDTQLEFIQKAVNLFEKKI